MKALLVLALLAAPAYATPYRCDGVRSGERTGIDPELIGLWQELARADTSDDVWADAVVRMAAWMPRPTSVEERVRVQHELLEIERRTAGDTARMARARAAAFELAHEIAPTARELDELADQPSLQGVLGTAIVQRATQTCGSGNSIHVAVNGGRLMFRPLRAGTTRALVATLVAFDRDGHPHVTPFVDAIEMRLGDDVGAPACVVEAGPDGALRPEPLDHLSAHPPFVMRSGDGVTCHNCHAGANTMHARDIDGDELARVDKLRARQVESLAEGFWHSFEH